MTIPDQVYRKGSVEPFGQTTIPQSFDLPYGLVVFAVVLMAIGGFAGAGWVEKKMAGGRTPAAGEERA
jgi:hypothetical protein